MTNKLYKELKELAENNDAFYISNQVDNGDNYEIFLYRMATYTDFQLPAALESRGIMFLNGVCVSRSPKKFFNLHECRQWPEHEDTNWDNYTDCMVKEDGSLISTWIDTSGNLRCKTKGSLHSIQAVMAEDYLNKNLKFKLVLESVVRMGYTVNMEIVSPDNRIVLAYEDTKLVILNIRNTLAGDPMSMAGASKVSRVLMEYWVEYVSDINMADVPKMNGENGEVIEGFVFCDPNTNDMVKCKTDRYVEIHHAKDDINHPKRLLMCVLENGSDDLRSLFEYDIMTIKYIDEFEAMVFTKYNNMVGAVELYYKKYKHLDRKDYAVKAQGMTIGKRYFSLIMSMYNDKEVKYKEFMIKNRETLFPDVKWKVEM